MKIFGQQKWSGMTFITICIFVFCIIFLLKFPGYKISTIKRRSHRESAYQLAYKKITHIKEMNFLDIPPGIWKPEKKVIDGMPVYLVVKIEVVEKNLKKINVEIAWAETKMNVLIKINTLISKYR